MGREIYQNKVWKWVLPYPDLCRCTALVIGGMNAWTPIRSFEPSYVEDPFLFDDINEIRDHFRLECKNYGKSFSNYSLNVQTYTLCKLFRKMILLKC